MKCVFCDIVKGDAFATILYTWYDALAIAPLNPVTEGHTLIIPKVHVMDYTDIPSVTAAVATRAAEYAQIHTYQSNLITSAGVLATQSVFHLHFHVVPRTSGDGLTLPWTEQ